MASYDELMAAAREADRQKDSVGAERLLKLAMQARQQEPTEQEPTLAPDEGTALDTFSDFGRGVNSGMRSASQFGQDAVHRLAGAVGIYDEGELEDTLATLNRKRAAQAESNAEAKARSPYAFAGGELVGEVAFTAPIGGFAGGGARALSTKLLGETAKKTIGATALAAEGAAVGAYTTDGGLEERGLEALKGAATDVVLGSAFNKVTDTLGAKFRKFRSKDAITDEVDKINKGTQQTVSDAREYGGVDIDGATASGDSFSRDMLEQLKADPEFRPMLAEFAAKQERQVTDKATEIAGRYGSLDNELAPELNLKAAQEAMVALKNADFAESKAAYKVFDELAAKADYSPSASHIDDSLGEIGDRLTKPNHATRGIASDINSELERWGLRGDGAKAEKDLTFGNYENLIQDINDMYSPTMKDSEKALIRDVKAKLEQSLDRSLEDIANHSGIDAAAVEAGRSARKLRSAYNDKWTKNDVVGKLTSTKRDVPDEFKLDYSKMLDRLNASDVKKLKVSMVGNPAGWKSTQQAPILKALQKATADKSEATMVGNVPKFNDNAFWGEIEKLDRTTRIELWGEDFVQEMDKVKSAWRSRARSNTTSGSSNKSGTAVTAKVLGAGRFITRGNARNHSMMANDLMPTIHRAMTGPNRRREVSATLDGKLTEGRLNEMRDEVFDVLENDYLGVDREDLIEGFSWMKSTAGFKEAAGNLRTVDATRSAQTAARIAGVTAINSEDK